MAKKKSVFQGKKIPDHPEIPFIEGDGTGPDIWKATSLVLNESVLRAYEGGRQIKWVEILAGEKAFEKTGSWLPDETLNALRHYRIGIKGPLTTPVGVGIRSLNVFLRQELDLYACIRPIQHLKGVPTPVKHPQKVNMVVFRENTEDVYAGLEWEAGSPKAEKLISFLKTELNAKVTPNSGIGIKPISEFCTKRLVRLSIKYALDKGLPTVTLVHKGNIMKFTEGAFRNWGYELAAEEFGDKTVTEEELYKEYNGLIPKGKVVIKDRIADATFQQVLFRPKEYHVIVTPNLNGDYLSDALAAQVGGLGMAPGANIGDHCALFEATHGTAPKYAGLDKVNPCSLILSGVMMLEYLGWHEAAHLIKKALEKTISERFVTYDLARQIKNAREVACSHFAQIVAEHIKAYGKNTH